MAKNDGDIMDFLMENLLKFFGWIIGILFKLTIGLIMLVITGIVKGIKALINKGENSTTASEPVSASEVDPGSETAQVVDAVDSLGEASEVVNETVSESAE